uniref:Protein related to Da-p36 n=1 Tax=Amblyomma variegatum TaxID=34610 RepID=Q75PV7_AMBVA|nr:protein related to Da-p36 [Amblyomma variegatum]
MHPKVAVGFLLLLASSREGACTMVNLTEEANIYIKKMERRLGEIDNWGLTENYTYWTRRHFTDGERPVVAAVMKPECRLKEEQEIVQSVELNDCNEIFTWNISHGIKSPFQLLVNVTLPMIRNGHAKHTKVVELDLSNLTIQKEIKNRVKHTGNLTQKVTMSCGFEAKTRFWGYFAFHVKRPRGDTPNYNRVNIAALENKAKGLHKSSGVLTYTIKGQYTQTLCRYQNNKRSKRSAGLQ